ncbi:hypothetical protein [Janthinobacterium lividum]|uniref:Uncharacterized protein n=1 Tax=Janthinobacterium lividum TaxID=29581 RepID=A0ABU0XWU6_9BURK|nr:hypothetical protein [Janthinobacterium lividum]MDQ4626711.1 hypothetical protein [Janthinobacterium lividum]MDQ4674322.1 hypothetical protein [Janthinobacterium lividum]MDQ4685053.1 hypothetical protein [Janthinobacterium lividum]
METSDVRVGLIYLDRDNPRHEPMEGDPELITYLLHHEGVRALAKDIATKGSLNPLDMLALVPHPKIKGSFIPAEGNRRVCVLKLLEDPDRAPTEADKKYFRSLRDMMPKPIKLIEARIFKNKAEARPWVSIRHEGEQGGIGTKKWDARQKARFNMDGGERTNPNAQATQIVEYAVESGLITEDDKANIALTTLTRYLTNPVFRDTVGLQNNRDLNITVPQDEFDRAVTRFLRDAGDKDSDVSSRSSAEERKAYAAKLRKDGDAPTTRGLPATPAAAASTGGKAESSTKPKRNNRGREHDKTVIPASFKSHISKDTVLKRIYDELRTLDAEFAFSAAYLLRALIEQTCTLYLKQENRGRALPKELHQKIEAVEKQLEAEGIEDRVRKNLRVMSSKKDSTASPDTLGHFVHGGAIPSKHDVFRTWDNISEAFAYIYTKLK